jgi:hypothetical protein
MDLAKVLRQLHEELENLDAAILSLERLQESGRRRGRPPALLAELRTASGEPGRRKGQPNSAEGSRK